MWKSQILLHYLTTHAIILFGKWNSEKSVDNLVDSVYVESWSRKFIDAMRCFIFSVFRRVLCLAVVQLVLMLFGVSRLVESITSIVLHFVEYVMIRNSELLNIIFSA